MTPPSSIQKKTKSKTAFTAVADMSRNFKMPMSPKKMGVLAVILALIGGYIWYDMTFVPPKGNNLYGICRAYIEQRMLYPTSLEIVQMIEKIPDTEDKKNPKRINYEIVFGSRDSYGTHRLDSVTCGFLFRSDLVGTPWQGIELERVLFNGRSSHGWADVYYPPDKKNPRAADDRSEDLEKFQAGIPSLLQNPPDLTLPFHDLYRISIKDLQDL